jgi:protoheme IX farnesyltransferase
MQTTQTYIAGVAAFLKAKVFDYGLLVKFRLSFTVVFSSLITYTIASGSSFSYEGLLMMFLGGFLVTGAANALNQVFEKDVDKLMTRTANRPLARGSMSNTEAILAAGICGLAGVSILWIYFNQLAAIIGALSLITYSFIYTPLKRISPVAVFVGAIPGALPPMIGWVAATGIISLEAYIITAIQFLWQFPHFWAIAWVAFDDYAKAGFYLLPSSGGKDRFTAVQNILYIAVLIPVSLLLFFKGNINAVSAVVILIAGIVFLYYAVKLFRSCETGDAKKLMFASIAYLPVVLLALLFGGK